MIVDEQGWDELKAGLGEMLEKILEIQSGSAERLAKADAAGVPVTVAMMGFEAPPSGDGKVAPSKED